MPGKNYFGRLTQAILGQGSAVSSSLSADADEAELRARVASLELDLRQRDEQISQMKREYGALEAAHGKARDIAGQEQLEKLLRKLCGTLASLSVLSVAARQGKDVSPADMAGLVADLEKQLASFGLKSIGQPGEHSVFDVSAHQRLSGGSVHAGSPVVVYLPGYRLGEKVLQKAMVTAKED